jgi:indole-3-glycerol phosphate synthase
MIPSNAPFYIFILFLLIHLHGALSWTRNHEISMRGDRVLGGYLYDMVRRKQIEVQNLLRRHSDPSDPLMMRMSYFQVQRSFNFTRAVRKPDLGEDKLGKMSIIVDMKRKSPTLPNRRDIISLKSYASFAELLARVNVDGLLMNTDNIEYGGSLDEIKESSKALKRLKVPHIPPILAKDVIIHPIQVSSKATLFILKINSIFSHF